MEKKKKKKNRIRIVFGFVGVCVSGDLNFTKSFLLRNLYLRMNKYIDHYGVPCTNEATERERRIRCRLFV